MKRIVLVVEDDPDIRSSLLEMFRDEGYRAVGVVTVDDALEQLRAGTFSVIVLDLGLPRRDGDELLEEMTHDGLQVPVVVVSASPRALTVASDYRVPFVRKPFDIGTLFSTVTIAIDRQLFPRRSPTAQSYRVSRPSLERLAAHGVVGPQRVEVSGDGIATAYYGDQPLAAFRKLDALLRFHRLTEADLELESPRGVP